MSTCCGGNADAILNAKRVLAEANGDAPFTPEQQPLAESGIQEPAVVRLEFVGANRGAIGYRGRATGQTYYGGDNPFDKYADVDPKDVDHLVSLGVWRVVSQPKPQRAAPRIEAVAVATEPPPISDTRTNGTDRPMLDLVADLVGEHEANQKAAALVKETRKR